MEFNPYPNHQAHVITHHRYLHTNIHTHPYSNEGKKKRQATSDVTKHNTSPRLTYTPPITPRTVITVRTTVASIVRHGRESDSVCEGAVACLPKEEEKRILALSFFFVSGVHRRSVHVWLSGVECASCSMYIVYHT